MLFQSIKSLHELGYIHRDIKPDNFRVKDNKIYLVDFGSCIKYKDDDGNHIPRKSGRMITGTHIFASVFT